MTGPGEPTDVVALGRSVVVRPGQAAPAAWGGCTRRPVTEVTPAVADELHEAWRERVPLVLELAPGLGLDDPVSPPPERLTGHQPWEWPVDLDLPGERLHHALWANSVDGRDPGRLRWRWAEEAQRAGAAPASYGGGARGGDRVRPDVFLPDGRPAVCDGGPLDAGLPARIGMAVLHRIAIEHRSLVPLEGGRIRTGTGRVVEGLAPDQIAAVCEARGGARVIAPAGSGKTRVLTERARTLVKDWGLPPGALALVAYNVRAAGEMRDRLTDVPDLRIRTLNALGLRLCGRASTIDERSVRSLLADLVSFPRRAETDPAAPWIEALSRVRLGLLSPDMVEDELGDVSDLDRVARTYRSELAARDAVDFDEQVVGAIERLLGDPQFRARSQRYARVLLIDEFQDLTPAHLLLIRLLSGPAGSVFAVGDDDQTIYGYAGATPRWLVDFARWFPGSATHGLEVNYRCPPTVVRAASNLLSRNGLRVQKTIRAARPDSDSPPGPELTTRSGAAGPAIRTADRVEELMSAGASTAEIAVLSRVNASLVPVQVHLGHRGVPVDATGDRRFLQRGGVRGALAWLEVATAPDGRLPGTALREAARRPKRGMGNSLLELLSRPRSVESLEGLSVWLEGKGSGRDAEKVDAFARDVALVRRAAPRGTRRVLQVVRRQIGAGGLDATAAALDQWSHGAIAAHLDDLDALVELAELEPDPGRFPSWLAGRLDAGRQEGGVTLASIHAVKGREWPHVVLHHVTDGLVPHRLSTDAEEERRIFHVGLTRTSHTVSLVPGETPSPFIAELDAPGRPDEGRGARRSRRRGEGTAGGAAEGTEAGTAARRAPVSPERRSQERSADLLPASLDLEFGSGGQIHRIVELGDDHAMCLVGGGPARTRVRYGTLVTHAGQSAILSHPCSEKAWEKLRAWRSEKARSLKVPAYVVFDDSTLRFVAARLPVSDTALLSVRGIGPAKLDTYGTELMSISEEMRAPD